jgi:hypothetical protein
MERTAMKTLVTHERLIDVLDYNKEKGEFVWIKNRYKNKVGTVAGYLNKTPHIMYRYVMIDGVNYSEHRLAWF